MFSPRSSMDRVLASEAKGYRFDSYRGRFLGATNTMDERMVPMKRMMILATAGVFLLWAGAIAADENTAAPDTKEVQVQPAEKAKDNAPQTEVKKEGLLDKMFGWMKPKDDSEKLASIQKKITAEKEKHQKDLQQIQTKLDRAKEGKDDKAVAKYQQEVQRENENYQKKLDILKREQAKVQQHKAEASAEAKKAKTEAVKEIEKKKEAKPAEVKKEAGKKKPDGLKAKKELKAPKQKPDQQADDKDADEDDNANDDEKPAKDKPVKAPKAKDKNK